MKSQKGITLIALVITIIVLLILAGVSIAMLTGDNGIWNQAKNAKTDTTDGAIADKINMALNGEYATLLAEGTLTGESIDAEGNLTSTTKEKIAAAEGIEAGDYTWEIRSSKDSTPVLKIESSKGSKTISGEIKYDSSTGKYSIDRAKYPGEE